MPADQEGMEDQLGALGVVPNAITLWNTFYLDDWTGSQHARRGGQLAVLAR